MKSPPHPGHLRAARFGEPTLSRQAGEGSLQKIRGIVFLFPFYGMGAVGSADKGSCDLYDEARRAKLQAGTSGGVSRTVFKPFIWAFGPPFVGKGDHVLQGEKALSPQNATKLFYVGS